MPKRKLTASLKRKIKENYSRLKKADYDGEALAYLNRVRGAAKGRKAKKQGLVASEGKGQRGKQPGRTKKDKKKRKKRIYERLPIHICGTIIQPNTEAYQIIEASAKLSKKSIPKYIKENEEAICKLLKNYLLFTKKEIDYLIRDIEALPSQKKTFVPAKGKEIPRVKTIFLLHSLKQYMLATCEIYEQVLIEFAYDLFGNIHVSVPYPIQYTKFKDCEELLKFIDEQFPNISYFLND